MKTKIVSVDFQNDFTAPGGASYRSRPAVDFIKQTLVPFLTQHNITLAEIISDYRQPRPGARREVCVPGTWGYESGIPVSVKDERVWIKGMNSPLWIRDHGGDPAHTPGLPFQDPKRLSQWAHEVVGRPDDTQVVLIGLTLDCCVLCAAQEFRFRGYQVMILNEAVDAYSGDQREKVALFSSPLKNWAEPIAWNGVKQSLF